MTGRRLLLGIGMGSVVGLGASAAVTSVYFAGSDPSPTTLPGPVTLQLSALDTQLAELEQRVAALAAPEGGENDPKAVPDANAALAEAIRLGIVEELVTTRPSLREDTVRRTAVALVREARRFGHDPLLLTAVARVESAYDPFATSHVGARGLLQVMVVTGGELLSSRGERLRHENELYDIETSVSLGAEYLAQMLERFDGNLDYALVAYNRGPRGARIALRGEYRDEVLAGYPRLVRRELTRLKARSEAQIALLDSSVKQHAM